MIELVPLARATVTLSPPIVLPSTPSGMRVIFEMTGYRLEGERLRATQRGAAAADWLVVGPEGTGTLDSRVTLETAEGTPVLLHYGGRVDASRGLGGAAIYAAFQFETGDERYAWLNRLLAVGKGTLDGSTLAYDVYELR
ncbi:MAG TPA: DUF3237 domain-containing protein [Candidatus Binatia bacterium]|nr:DUF3237 domain-containing protein [Candidatus Binatia bacterium]